MWGRCADQYINNLATLIPQNTITQSTINVFKDTVYILKKSTESNEGNKMSFILFISPNIFIRVNFLSSTQRWAWENTPTTPQKCSTDEVKGKTVLITCWSSNVPATCHMPSVVISSITCTQSNHKAEHAACHYLRLDNCDGCTVLCALRKGLSIADGLRRERFWE